LSSDDRKQSLQERKNVLKWMGLLQDGRPTYGNDEEGRTQYQIFLGPRSNTWYLLHWRPKLKDFLQKLKEKSSSKFPRFCCAIATNGEARYAEDIVEQISGEHGMADSELFEVTKSFCPPEGWSRHKEEQNRQIDEHPKDCKQVWGFPVEMVAILDDQSETILHHGKEQKTWKEGQRENVVGVFPYKYNYLEGAEDRDLSLEPQRTQLQQMRMIYFREVHRMCLKFRQGDWFDLPESDDSRSIMHNPVTLPLPDIKSCIHEVSQRELVRLASPRSPSPSPPRTTEDDSQRFVIVLDTCAIYDICMYRTWKQHMGIIFQAGGKILIPEPACLEIDDHKDKDDVDINEKARGALKALQEIEHDTANFPDFLVYQTHEDALKQRRSANPQGTEKQKKDRLMLVCAQQLNRQQGAMCAGLLTSDVNLLMECKREGVPAMFPNNQKEDGSYITKHVPRSEGLTSVLMRTNISCKEIFMWAKDGYADWGCEGASRGT